jgi:phosphatidylglycerophosphate synthase
VAEPRPGSPRLTRTSKPDSRDGRDSRGRWDDYSARWAALHGGVDPRHSSRPTRVWIRIAYAVGRGMAALRLSPDTITVVGLLLSAAVPVVVLFGGWWLFVAAGLVLASAVADSADGAVAVLTSRTSRLGAFTDAVADRLSEAAWLLALWLAGVPGILVAVCLALCYLHEYARARAAAAGMVGVGVVSVAERPVRVILTVVALVLGGAASPVSARLAAGVMTIVVAVWVLLGLLGAGRLLTAIRAALR